MKEFHDGTTYKLFNVCACGCGAIVRNNFKQGHDMKVKVQMQKGR